MALGTDQVALAVVIELKSKYNIKLVAAVPFRGQEDAWSFPTRALYACLLNKCDEIVYTDEMGGSSKLAGYDVSKLYARSKYMVQRADGVIAVWNGKESGGTYDAVRLAKTAGKPVAIIDPRNLNGITRA